VWSNEDTGVDFPRDDAAQSYAAGMAIEFLTVNQAARALGRDPSGLHKAAKAGQFLRDQEGRVILAGGVLVTSLEELVSLAEAGRLRAEDAERAAQAARDEAELTKLEFGEYKARSSSQLQALIEAHEASARALRELAPRS
jgi:hypothetical protein